MSKEISWQVELIIKLGKLDQFRVLTRKMVESTTTEPGTLIYERFINDDAKVYFYERYRDSASAVRHLLEFNKRYGKDFNNMVERKQFRFFGTPNDELKQLLKELNVTFYKLIDGFSLFS